MSVRALLHATALCVLAAAGAAAATAGAQAYPTKPIRVIIPFPPGGGSDVIGRVVAQSLGDRLGTQMVIDNRAGAGGIIGKAFDGLQVPGVVKPLRRLVQAIEIFVVDRSSMRLGLKMTQAVGRLHLHRDTQRIATNLPR